MTDLEAHYRAILANPHDKLVRLSYADHLFDRSEGRHSRHSIGHDDFIRLQIEGGVFDWNYQRYVDKLCWVHDQRANWVYKVGEPKDGWYTWNMPNGWENGEVVTGELRKIKFVMEKGFVDRIEAGYQHIVDYGREIFTNHPLTSIGVIDIRPVLVDDHFGRGYVFNRDRREASYVRDEHALLLPTQKCLRGMPSWVLRYATPEEAIEALETAIMMHGRRSYLDPFLDPPTIDETPLEVPSFAHWQGLGVMVNHPGQRLPVKVGDWRRFVAGKNSVEGVVVIANENSTIVEPRLRRDLVGVVD